MYSFDKRVQTRISEILRARAEAVPKCYTPDSSIFFIGLIVGIIITRFTYMNLQYVMKRSHKK